MKMSATRSFRRDTESSCRPCELSRTTQLVQQKTVPQSDFCQRTKFKHSESPARQLYDTCMKMTAEMKMLMTATLMKTQATKGPYLRNSMKSIPALISSSDAT